MSADEPLRRPIPLARSILWAPASGGRRPGDIPVPIFLSQAALTAIHEHLAGPPQSGQGSLGFLLGDLCECPETNVSYLIIDAALRLNQALYGDRSRDVVTRLWDRIEAQLDEQQAHLLGWYHTHPPLPLALSPDDVETHEHYFGEPWQVALLIATDAAEPAGAFFRAGAEEWISTPLPFYELLQDDSIRPDGKKRSFVTWKNYRAYNPVAPQTGATPRAPSAKPQAPPPEPEPEPAPPPPAPASRRPSGPQERSSELKFLTAAEDFAQPTPSPRPPAAPRPAPPRSAPPPPPSPPEPAAPEPAEEPIAYEGEAAEESAWPTEEFVESEWPAEEAEPEPPPPPPPPLTPAELRRRRARRQRLWRRVWRTALALVLVGGAGAAYWWFQPQLPSIHWSTVTSEWAVLTGKWAALKGRLRRRPSAPAPATPPRGSPRPPPRAAQPTAPSPAPPSPYGRLDRLGDSVRLVVRSFGDHSQQFDRNKPPCGDLARWLESVEARWTAYTAARRSAGALDAAHEARDAALYSAVDSVERRFEKSGCPRP